MRNHLTAEGQWFAEYDPQALPLIKSLPGARFHGRRCSYCPGGHEVPYWQVSVQAEHLPRVLQVAEQLGLEIAPELWARLDALRAAAPLPPGLYPYQEQGVHFLRAHPRALLADDMGLGKTVQVLAALPPQAAALVVCPAAVKAVWAQETRRWRQDLRLHLLSGQGAWTWPRPGELVITNYDILPDWLLPPPRQRRSWKEYRPQYQAWRQALRQRFPEAKQVRLIVDEAQYVKSFDSVRSRKVRELAHLCAAGVWGLTGTPLENRPPDLYGVLSSLGLAGEVFQSWPRFCALFHAQKNPWGGWEWGDPSPQVPRLLRRVMLRRRRDEVLPDLPRKRYLELPVAVEDEVLLRDLDSTWQGWGEALRHWQREELPPFEAFSAIRERLARARIPALLEYVETCEEAAIPLVVFSAHVAPLDAVGARPGWAAITGATPPARRQQAVTDFQEGRLRGLAVSIRAAGVGITLTRAWRALFVDLDWVPGANAQAEDRLCRIGQTATHVEIVRMVSDHPLDRHLLALLVEKQQLIQQAIEGNT
jgi:SNF2 family DNA or RNA helicase